MKKFHEPIFAWPRHLAGRVEVVDGRNMPLCVMDYAAVRAQGLCHRSVALVLRDRRNNLLIVQDAHGQPGFALFGPCHAGLGYAESCEIQICGRLGPLLGQPRLLRIAPPCPENFNSFTGLCELVLSEAMLSSLASSMRDSLLVEYSDLTALRGSACGLSPFFARLLEQGALAPVRQAV